MAKPQLVVIGGGPGGLVVTSVAAQLGLRVVLVEASDRLGGDCLHTGCVPSKSLLAMAGLVASARHGARLGVLESMPATAFPAAMAHVRKVIEHIQQHDDPERFRGYGADVRFGRAAFIDPHRVTVDEEIITGRRFVIATGSQPAVPPIAGLDETGYETSDTIFALAGLPPRLAVLGAGPVGLELAQAFARFGSAVTVIEQADRLLPGMPAGQAGALQQALEQEGVEFRLSADVSAVRRDGDQRQLQLGDGSSVECDRILVATGRRPAIHDLGLESAGIEAGRQGIRVDARMRTSRRHIYAVGDVANTPWPYTHVAEYQAGIALANIAFRVPKKADYRVVPRVIYTDPEVASVGLSETDADMQGMKYQVAEFPLEDVDRAIADDRTAGSARILVSRGRIVGASVVGAHAGELLHELALAMQVNARVRHISELIHAYPTYAQLHRRSVNSLYAGLLQSRGTRLLVRTLNALLP